MAGLGRPGPAQIAETCCLGSGWPGLAWPWAGLDQPPACFWFLGAVFGQLLDYSQTREDWPELSTWTETKRYLYLLKAILFWIMFSLQVFDANLDIQLKHSDTTVYMQLVSRKMISVALTEDKLY